MDVDVNSTVLENCLPEGANKQSSSSSSGGGVRPTRLYVKHLKTVGIAERGENVILRDDVR